MTDETVDQWLITAPQSVFEIILDVTKEISDLEETFGRLHMPDEIGGPYPEMKWRQAQEENVIAIRAKKWTWKGFITGMFWGTLAAASEDELRARLVQLAAAAETWIRDIDTRTEDLTDEQEGKVRGTGILDD